MSSIDKRIVDMQFNNGEFEKNIAASMKSLDELKNKGLNFDKSTKRLNELQRAGKSFSLEGMAANVQHVADRLSTMGIVGITAIQRITNSAITAGKQLASSFTIDPVKAGLREYETQISAIQTILSNTRSKGSTLTDVNEALDELNQYADKTIYNFTEMAKNIGTFTAAGVELDKSTAAIKGIANLAAVSGSNAQQASVAMYQLSQALSSGTVRLMDWNSVVNAGMGGEVFQNALKETARLHGVAIDAMVKKEGSFRETLQNGWLTSAILTETLQKFTGDLTKEQLISLGYTNDQAEGIVALGKDASDAATKVKTFTQLIDTLKEALGSGWAQTWENVIGNFEEARDLWTAVSDAIGAVITRSSDQRNNLLADWKEQGGRDDLIKGLTYAFEALWGLVLAVGEAMESIFPPATVDTLLGFSKGVKQLGQNLRSLLYYSTEYTTGFDKVTTRLFGDTGKPTSFKKGDKGEAVKELQKQLTDAGYALEQDGIFGEKTEAALRKFQKDRNLIVDGIFGGETRKNLLESLGITDKEGFTVEKLANTVTYLGSKLKELERIAAGGFAIFDIGVQVFGFLWDVILLVGDALSPITDMFVAIAAAVGDWFVSVDDGLKKAEPFTSWLETIENFLKPLKTSLKTATDAILKFFGIGTEVDKSTDKLRTFADVLGIIKEFLFGSEVNTGTTTLTKKGLFQKIGDFLDGISDWYTKSELAQTVVNKLKQVVEDIKVFLFGSEGDIATTTSAQPNIVERIKSFFQSISDWYDESETAQAFVATLKGIVDDIKTFLFGSEGDETTSGQPNIVQRIGDFFQSISDWYEKSETAQKVVDKLKKIVDDIKVFLFGSEGDAATTTSAKPNIIERIKTFSEDLYNTLMENDKIKAIAEAIKTFFEPIIQAVKDFFSNDQEEKKEENPEEKGEGILGPFIRVWEWVKEKWEDISDWCERAFKDADSFLKKVGTEGLIGILLGGLATLGILGVIKTIKKTFKGLGEVVDIFKNKFKKGIKVQPISKSILQIAFAIGILVAAIYVLGTMKPDELARGAGVLGGIIALLITMVVLMNKFVKAEQAGNIEKVGKSLLDLAIAIGILVAIVWLLGNMDGNLFAKGMGLLTIMLVVIGTFLWAMKKYGSTSSDYKGLIGMAFAVGIMALIAWVLGKMDQTELIHGITALGAIMLLLGLFISALKNQKGDSNVQYKGLFSLAIALGILTGLVWILSKVDWNEGWKGMVALFVLMAALGAFIKSINKDGAVKVKLKGLIGAAIALGILAGIAMILGGMEAGAMWRGVAAISVIMLGLSELMKSLGESSKTLKTSAIFAMLAMAAGLALVILAFSYALNMVKDVDPLVIGVFTGALMSAIGGLVAVIVFLKKQNMGVGKMAKGAAAVGVAVATFVGIVTALIATLGWIDQISGQGLTSALESGGTVLRGLGQAIGLFVAGIREGILGINDLDSTSAQLEAKSASLAALADAVEGLKSTLIVLGLALVLSMFVAAIPGGSIAMLKGAAALSVSIGIVVAALAIIVGGLGALDMATQQKFSQALDRGAEIFYKLGLSIGNFFGGIKNGFNRPADYSLFTKNVADYADALEKLAAAMDTIAETKDIDAKTGNAIRVTKIIKNFFDEMVQYPIDFRALKGYVTAPGQLSTDMSAFAVAVSIYATRIKTLGNPVELLLNTIKATIIAKIVHGFFSTLKGYPVYANSVPGYYTAPGELSKDMSAFAMAIGAFATNVALVGANENIDVDTDKAIEVATKVKGFFDQIAGKTINPLGLMFYNAVASSFLTHMQTFGVTAASYGAVLKNISETNIEEDSAAAISVAEKIRDFLSQLTTIDMDPYRNAIGNFFLGKSNSESFMDQMVILGDNMRSVSTNFKDLGTSNIVRDADAATTAAKTIAGFLQFLSSDQFKLSGYGEDGSTPLPSFALFEIQMSSLAQAIVSFGDTTKNVDLSRFTTISWGIGAIGKALSSISATSESESFKSFKEAFDTVKEMLSGTGSDGTKLDPSGLVAALDTKKIDDAFITFMDNVAVTMDNSTSSIQDYVTGFNAAGSELASSLNAGVSGVTDTSGVSTMVGGLLTAANNFKSQFKTVGWNLGMGLREGLIKSTALAVAAAEYVAKAMLAKLNEVFNINSPSKEGISIGKSLDEGLAIGASKFAYIASKSAEGVGTSVLDTTRDALSGISDVIDSNMESDPVIRPVLDLSNISSGARTIGGLFSGRQTVAVDSLQSKAMASSIRMPGNSAAANQNGSATTAIPATSTGSKFDFTNSQFIFKDKMDIRTFKLELAGLERDDDRAHGSVH